MGLMQPPLRGLRLPADFKPTGKPVVNRQHRLGRNIVAYGFDTGLGGYRNLVSGAPFNVNALNGTSLANIGNGMFSAALTVPAISTKWGSACYWNQAFDFTHRGWMIDVDDPAGQTNQNIIQRSTFLAGQPAGAGFTVFTNFVPFGPNSEDTNNSLCNIFGRPFVPDNNNWNWGIVSDPTCLQFSALTLTGSSSGGISGWGAPSSAQIGSTFTGGVYKTRYSLVITVQNDSQTDASNSSATGKFYVNGSLSGTATTGLNIPSSGFTYPANLQSAETQIMLGLLYHVASPGSAFPCVNGLVLDGGFANRAWSAGEVAYHYRAPFSFLRPQSGDDMLAGAQPSFGPVVPLGLTQKRLTFI